jgi:diacylglycerol kinase family enzyme
MNRRRLAAGVALASGVGASAMMVAAAVAPRRRRSPALLVGSGAALAIAIVAGRSALRQRIARPRAPRPRRPFLFYNPKSGGGKAARYRLAEEARARGIQAIELAPGSELAALVRQALDAGADALAMAGGDGSQAIVAALAAEAGLPYACIPSGTRNHFALDLGVDRDDVVGALDALVDGVERVIDLGEVNGRVFVNNVSLGLYGHAVQRDSYRAEKVRTLFETVPEVVGPEVNPELRWHGPDGAAHERSLALVVSNNAYRLDPGMGAAGRPRLDAGVLGVTVLGAPGHAPPLTTWTARSFDVDARGPVPAGVDGEALLFDPPLRFRVRPAALRCRIARHHPGVSPAAFAPAGVWTAIRRLAQIAAHPTTPSRP